MLDVSKHDIIVVGARVLSLSTDRGSKELVDKAVELDSSLFLLR